MTRHFTYSGDVNALRGFLLTCDGIFFKIEDVSSDGVQCIINNQLYLIKDGSSVTCYENGNVAVV